MNTQRFFLSISILLLSGLALRAQGPFEINGTVKSANDEGVGQVVLTLTDSNGDVIDSAETDCDGVYQLEGLSDDEVYTLQLEKDGGSLNGVSTFDRVLLSKHILGIDLLDEPYNVYAADVNATGTITVVDILWIQTVVLAIEEAFPGGNWHFFSGTENQPSNNIPVQVTADLNGLDFIAVKKGDVNHSAILCE